MYKPTIWIIKQTAVPMIPTVVTGARELMANAIADVVDDNSATVSIKKKNFSTLASKPNKVSIYMDTNTLTYIQVTYVTLMICTYIDICVICTCIQTQEVEYGN